MRNSLIARRHLMFTVDPPEGDQGGGGEQAKTFTQAEVDAIVLKRAERVAADKYADHADLKAKAKRLDDIEAANASDMEKAVKAARDETRAEVTTAVLRERVLDKIEVAAAGKFADVEDARLRVGRKADEFVKDGSIDAKAIAAEVDAELERAPHLRVSNGKAVRPRPDPSQGASGGDHRPGSVAQVMADRAAARATRSTATSS